MIASLSTRKSGGYASLFLHPADGLDRQMFIEQLSTYCENNHWGVRLAHFPPPCATKYSPLQHA